MRFSCTNLSKWYNTLCSVAGTPRRRRSWQPAFEQLEARTLLASGQLLASTTPLTASPHTAPVARALDFSKVGGAFDLGAATGGPAAAPPGVQPPESGLDNPLSAFNRGNLSGAGDDFNGTDAQPRFDPAADSAISAAVPALANKASNGSPVQGDRFESFLARQGDNLRLVFDFNLGAILPFFGAPVPTEEVADLTSLAESILPTVATLSGIPLEPTKLWTNPAEDTDSMPGAATDGSSSIRPTPTQNPGAAHASPTHEELGNLNDTVSGLEEAMERNRQALRLALLEVGACSGAGAEAIQEAFAVIYRSAPPALETRLGDNGRSPANGNGGLAAQVAGRQSAGDETFEATTE